MFSTTCPPCSWQYHWPTSNPTISHPALHNARYEGWPHPPLELPQVASPPSTTWRAALAFDVPSHCLYEANTTHTQPHPVHPQYDAHPRTNLGLQGNHLFVLLASADIMGPVGSQHHDFPGSLAWNGGTYTPSLQGTSEMCTTT
ncbi:hypothetical protein DEU56DRAFT_912191 [Suillus clintonianus]|uniref:uncharacterized protein n=1 Tax=Suillus clintonianus TaxID=1904413 RepID=UPI001B8765A2|nr:uncharacterized protein DEU56DRAFT_912191 [Suillus clintonianus]KAG2139352.1 hypothetical protein DEU56DRAFT_912191 [Suillus clintonianus]